MCRRKAHDSAVELPKLIEMLEKSHPIEVPGTAVFLTQDPDTAPSALLHNLKHNRVLHSQNFIVTGRRGHHAEGQRRKPHHAWSGCPTTSCGCS